MTKKVPAYSFDKQFNTVKNSDKKYLLKQGTKYMVSDLRGENNLFSIYEKKDRVINGALLFKVEIDGAFYPKGTELAQFQGDYSVCTVPAKDLIEMKGE